MVWQQAYMDRFYRSRAGWRDGTTEFHDLCARAGRGARRILEIGAGPSNPTSSYLATLAELHGVDVDSAALGNDALSGAHVIVRDAYPFDDGYFDLCVSNYVLEHVADPRAHLAEVRRVLGPGGAYVFRTPNRFHYVALVSAATPHWFHELVANRLRGQGEEAHDPYPTAYRMNSARAVARHAKSAGFAVEVLDLVEKEPSYGMAARPLFLAFMAYERLVNATPKLANLRANLFGLLRKPR